MKVKKERMDKYWICGDCAKSRGWIGPKGPVTCTTGLCGHCADSVEVWLIPVVDFEISGKRPVWD